jgi:signal peptidase II
MIIIEVLILGALIAADQITKFLALKYLAPIGSMSIIDGFLDFAFVRNDGAAFGLFQGARWFFLIFTVLIVAGIIYYYVKFRKSKRFAFARAALLLITAGAVGNSIDRFTTGLVVDFINVRFMRFPVFNVADMYIVVGTIVLLIYILFFAKDDERPVTDTKPEDGAKT